MKKTGEKDKVKALLNRAKERAVPFSSRSHARATGKAIVRAAQTPHSPGKSKNA